MRTEAQKKMDKIAGLENVEYKLDVMTGKIVEKGVINKSFDGEVLEKSMVGYKQQIDGLEQQLGDAKEKLKACDAVEETEDVKKFVETQRQAGLFQQKKSMQEVVQKREEEIQFHRDNYKEQTRLVNEWRDWKKKFRKPVKEEPKEEAQPTPAVS